MLAATAITSLIVSLLTCILTISPPRWIDWPGTESRTVDMGTEALRKLRRDAPNDSIIKLNHSALDLSSPIADGPNKAIEWSLDGSTLKNKINPAVCVGADWIESFIGESGGHYFGRCETPPQAAPVVRVSERITHSGGLAGYVLSALNTRVEIPQNIMALNNYVWANLTELSSSATGLGQHVASASRAVRPSDALNDGKGERSEIWANYAEISDQTGADPISGGSAVIQELDMYANGADTTNKRIGLDIEIARFDKTKRAAQLGIGVKVGSSNDASAYPAQHEQSFVGTGFKLSTAFTNAGIDLSQGVSLDGAPAIRLSAGQSVDFSGDNEHYIRYNPATKCFEFKVGIDKPAVTLPELCD